MFSANPDDDFVSPDRARAEKAEAELRATLKAVLHHFGPEGANKVTTTALTILTAGKQNG